ncbi:hypothetical protein SANTM175S_03626 [Streptomyces antimycoticus]
MTDRPASSAAIDRSTWREAVGSDEGRGLVEDQGVRVGEQQPGKGDLLGGDGRYVVSSVATGESSPSGSLRAHSSRPTVRRAAHSSSSPQVLSSGPVLPPGPRRSGRVRLSRTLPAKTWFSWVTRATSLRRVPIDIALTGASPISSTPAVGW